MPGRADDVVARAAELGREPAPASTPDTVGVSTDEITDRAHLEAVWAAFGVPVAADLDALDARTPDAVTGRSGPDARRS